MMSKTKDKMTGIFQFIDCSSVIGNEESQEIWPCIEAHQPFIKEEAKSQKFLVLRLKKKTPTNNETQVNGVKQEVLEIKEEVIYDDAESTNDLPKELNSENDVSIKTELKSDMSTCSSSPLNEILSTDTTLSTTPTEDNCLQMGNSYQHIIETVQRNATLPLFLPRSNMSNLEKAIDRVATGADSATHQVLLNHSKIKFIPSVQERIVHRPKLLTTCKYKTCVNLEFPNELSFIKHLWVLHSIFMCEICKRRFSMESLVEHKNRFHSMQRRYKCTVCRNSFSNSAFFANHKCTPDQKKPYKCTVCQDFFSTGFDLRNHQFSNHNRGPFACNFCKVSAFEGGLKRHAKSLRYQCFFCNSSFFKKLQLRKHIKHHNFVMSTQIRSGLQLN